MIMVMEKDKEKETKDQMTKLMITKRVDHFKSAMGNIDPFEPPIVKHEVNCKIRESSVDYVSYE